MAFTLARWPPRKRFPYGYGRVEDLAGVAIVLTIVLSALGAGYESITRLLHPQPVQHLCGADFLGCLAIFTAVMRGRRDLVAGS